MSKCSIEVFTEDVDYNYPNLTNLKDWIRASLKTEEKSCSYINIIFCSDKHLLSLNQEYLSHDYYTDIITFEYAAKPIEGELYISIDRVSDNAENLNIPLEMELQRVIIHGILHLAGYGDKSKEEIAIIRAKEDHYLSLLKPHDS